ncbi:transposase [Streptomyces sp. NPDC127033]|uniref:transposase n=1 Tax=Streptomyces sp. NPDC127033 TaxID=3347110 RepID=UPI00365D56B0
MSASVSKSARDVAHKRSGLVEALAGRFGDHHAFLLRTMLGRIDACIGIETCLSERIELEMAPFRRKPGLLATIPGVARTAPVVLAETGADMERFGSADHLASRSGVCPGNHESAGQQLTGRTRHGNPWRKAVPGRTEICAARA